MMKHQGTQRLETTRLILRQFQESDARAMYDNWASDPEVTRFLTWPPHSSPETSAGFLADWLHSYEKADYYQWAIELKELGEVIGSISVVKMDEKVESVVLGYCIGKKWWGQGITPEAAGALLDFFFRRVGVNKVEACHDVNNPNSGRVMEKLGMQREGVWRAASFNNQGLCDEVWYSILKKEYMERAF